MISNLAQRFLDIDEEYGGPTASASFDLLVNKSLQPTYYPYDCSTVNEDGEVFDGSSRVGDARTRLNSGVIRLQRALVNHVS
jgi:hypothetical protein